MSNVILVVLPPEGIPQKDAFKNFKDMLGNNNILYASPKGEIPENFDVVSGNESPKFLSLRECNINHFDAVCFPSAVGSMEHLSNDETLQKLLFSCKAQQKPICAIGYSVCSLASAKNNESNWAFDGYRMTGISVMEIVKTNNFANCPIIMENFIRDNGGYYSGRFLV